MLFNTFQFVCFFPIVTIMYYVLPQKYRWWVLLVASYYFYMCWNVKYAGLMLLSTGITYLSGLLMVYCPTVEIHGKNINSKKIWLILSFISNLSILFFFKYFDFLFDNIDYIYRLISNTELEHPAFDIILPVGISFYTFQALGYTVDVYREDVKAERNFFRYALFVSFFPQLVAGPIERSKNLLEQLKSEVRFDYVRAKKGLLLMLWGLFQKMVIADRIAIFVDVVYANPRENVAHVLFATILFAVQVYCDFSGYSNVAIGAAEVLGFNLMQNFNTPYFARSVSEFWRRWHISLSTWFRDYLYIPLGGNRKGRFRKYINLMIVFTTSGLWHGANWTYVIWGTLNGIYQVLGDCSKKYREKIKKFLKVKEEAFSYTLLQTIITFTLIDISWIFFRATSVTDALFILKTIVTTPFSFIKGIDNVFLLGLDEKDMLVLFLAIGILLFVSLCNKKGIQLREWLLEQGIWFQWIVYYCGIFGVLIFGIYGVGYDASAFIYFQF